MMFNDKKGIAVENIVKIVIFLACLLSILYLYNYIFNSTDTLVADQNCQSSIKAYLASTTIVGAPKDITKIDCPVREVKITSSNKDIERKQIANTMKYCWELWGNGQYDSFEAEGTYCHVCALIDFKYQGKTLDKMSDYLANKEIIIKNKPITYYEYMKPVINEFGEIKKTDGILTYSNLNTSKKYVVLYTFNKGIATSNFQEWKNSIFKTPPAIYDESKTILISQIFLVEYVPSQLTFCQYIPVKQ